MIKWQPWLPDRGWQGTVGGDTGYQGLGETDEMKSKKEVRYGVVTGEVKFCLDRLVDAFAGYQEQNQQQMHNRMLMQNLQA